jgi:hypothetical protein
MFTQSDMDPATLWRRPAREDGPDGFRGDTVGPLPETFVAHTMSEKRVAPIAIALSIVDTSMAAVSSVLWMVASPELGASIYA